MSTAISTPYDLGQPYFVGMPHFPTHPPFLFGLTKLHGEIVLPDGGSSAADVITMSGHTGTHIDALNHFSCMGKFFDGHAVQSVQSYGGGVRRLSVDTVAPISRRAVLLDIAGALNVSALEPDHVVTPEQLDACAVDVRPGDVVVIRTGWGQLFRDPAKYASALRMPGVELAGAKWLSERRPFAVGSDTLAFEHMPSPKMAVHIHLLVETGIHIIENLNLEEISRDQVREFQFVGAPLKIEGGTGAPIRPLGFVQSPISML
ncbi:MAG TPA: cyclase family protein [Bryobacteraceae bacterium]|nr:cyclase family protein [Bryobacteraceae bacterium]